MLIAGNVIGKGAYGEVVMYKNETQEYAVKIISAKQCNLLEISILATYRHPYLMNAEYIDYDGENNKVYMFMEAAKNDLSQRIRNLIPLDINLAKNWCYQIAKGVACLHQNKLIHADLKPSNILYFNDQCLKITDFTLTVKKWDSNSFDKQACTINYRPPEVFTQGKWDESLDIWSLGCIFYEIVFARPLFHHHKDISTNKNRKRLWQRMYNELLEWRKYSCQEDINDPFVPYDIDYHPLKISADLVNHAALQDLLMKMLRWKSSERLTISEVLAHPWLNNVESNKLYPEYIPNTVILSFDKYNRYSTYISYYNVNKLVTQLALSLCSRADNLFTEKIIAKVCTSMALRLCNFNLVNYPLLTDEDICIYESVICKHLNYVLHVL
jgi:serine/threonine protein kinase